MLERREGLAKGSRYLAPAESLGHVLDVGLVDRGFEHGNHRRLRLAASVHDEVLSTRHGFGVRDLIARNLADERGPRTERARRADDEVAQGQRVKVLYGPP